jgi:dTMP kinase
MIDLAVGDTRPNLTIVLNIAPEIRELRHAMRQSTMPFMRDRIEEADRSFFDRVDKGFAAVAAAEPERVRALDASGSIESVSSRIWDLVRPVLPKIGRW